jgi:hypothetical protein
MLESFPKRGDESESKADLNKKATPNLSICSHRNSPDDPTLSWSSHTIKRPSLQLIEYNGLILSFLPENSSFLNNSKPPFLKSNPKTAAIRGTIGWEELDNISRTS